MYDQSLIQVRVERPLKEDVTEIFTSLGIDVSTAVRIFLQRCRAVRGIPFALTVPEEKPRPRMGMAQGKWTFPANWEVADHQLDKEIEKDFYADSL